MSYVKGVRGTSAKVSLRLSYGNSRRSFRRRFKRSRRDSSLLT
ncbi:hypothetical protein EVA_13470 [gut metagenome]|uniref:Uncharacterized protein n=1 Tax=gut metagenome TaxID=749906 RepID=J9FTX6_9ZZZZ